MINKYRFLIALTAAAILIIGVVLYFRTESAQISPGVPQPENQTASSSNQPVMAIEFTEFTDNHWDKKSPVVENQKLKPVNIQMADTGFIRYKIDLTDRKSTGSVSVILSSALLTSQQSNDPDLTSDVTLFINGKEQGTQIVIKDTGENPGQRYNFNVSNFQTGQNSIEFQVKKDAAHQHGIKIWSPILVDFR